MQNKGSSQTWETGQTKEKLFHAIYKIMLHSNRNMYSDEEDCFARPLSRLFWLHSNRNMYSDEETCFKDEQMPGQSKNPVIGSDGEPLIARNKKKALEEIMRFTEDKKNIRFKEDILRTALFFDEMESFKKRNYIEWDLNKPGKPGLLSIIERFLSELKDKSTADHGLIYYIFNDLLFRIDGVEDIDKVLELLVLKHNVKGLDKRFDSISIETYSSNDYCSLKMKNATILESVGYFNPDKIFSFMPMFKKYGFNTEETACFSRVFDYVFDTETLIKGIKMLEHLGVKKMFPMDMEDRLKEKIVKKMTESLVLLKYFVLLLKRGLKPKEPLASIKVDSIEQALVLTATGFVMIEYCLGRIMNTLSFDSVIEDLVKYSMGKKEPGQNPLSLKDYLEVCKKILLILEREQERIEKAITDSETATFKVFREVYVRQYFDQIALLEKDFIKNTVLTVLSEDSINEISTFDISESMII